MAKKKSMIPVAFIVTDEIPSRFETAYASTLYETYEMSEALSADPKKTPAIHYFANTLRLLNLSVPNNKIFAIYNPDPKRLVMAKIGDGDKVIVYINNMAALKRLKQTYDCAGKVVELARAAMYFSNTSKDVCSSRNLRSKISDKMLLKTLKDTGAALPQGAGKLMKELGMHLIQDFKV